MPINAIAICRFAVKPQDQFMPGRGGLQKRAGSANAEARLNR